MKKNLWLALLLTIGILSGCAPTNTPQPNEKASNTSVQKTETKEEKFVESTDKLLTFNSCKDMQSTLKAHFAKAQKEQQNLARPMFARNMQFDALEMSVESDAPAAKSAGAGASEKYSGTNVQEFGVDEADIIKNDGKYIYMIRQNSIRIIETDNGKLNPVANFEVEKEGFYPREMYLDGDKLTVIGNHSEEIELEEVEVEIEPEIIDNVEIAADIMIDEPMMGKRGFAPGGYYPSYNRYKQMTTSVTFDIANRAKPTQTRMVSVEGNYQNSRKINEVVYLVTNKYQDNYWGRPMPIERPFPMPIFYDSSFKSEKIVGECGTVDYMPNFESPNYLIVAAIDTENLDKKVGRKMVLGSGNQIYASSKNLYVTKNKYWYHWGRNNAPKTEIFKFSLNGTEVKFEEKGEVIGTVLNQFSMSEDADENFRIATQENQKGARMTILNKNLVQTGAVKNIAPGENIKSVRFMGDKGYMVTFKNVDPLFVIDLNPTEPKILGKLKIPGWSDYLHPFKENYLIGIGKEVNPEAEHKKRLTSSDIEGVKISIFDITDLSDPKEIWKKVIGEQGSYTEALNNHKAFMFDAKEGILALPMTVNQKDGPKRNNWQPSKTVYKGAFVYDVSIENGFELRGKATHYNDKYWEKSKENRRYGNHEFDIQRVIFIGDNFYTIAPNTVASHSWDKVEKIEQITLDQKACEEIYEAMECGLQNQCKTVQKEWEECSVDNEDFSKSCEPKTQFLRCESK